MENQSESRARREVERGDYEIFAVADYNASIRARTTDLQIRGETSPLAFVKPTVQNVFEVPTVSSHCAADSPAPPPSSRARTPARDVSSKRSPLSEIVSKASSKNSSRKESTKSRTVKQTLTSKLIGASPTSVVNTSADQVDASGEGHDSLHINHHVEDVEHEIASISQRIRERLNGPSLPHSM